MGKEIIKEDDRPREIDYERRVVMFDADCEILKECLNKSDDIDQANIKMAQMQLDLKKSIQSLRNKYGLKAVDNIDIHKGIAVTTGRLTINDLKEN